ncbi:hypothetical protein [uncultured Bradyrhizobium sp.]|jgi:hypothetical protein|uniref:hypothetical protein n=1 Tax=uncultured Bradyrhizobium sp. TaxID=199684 RepID=UPI002634C639|nr:hypothetical protein [uncultured Bradyrhizobium sp.]
MTPLLVFVPLGLMLFWITVRRSTPLSITAGETLLLVTPIWTGLGALILVMWLRSP